MLHVLATCSCSMSIMHVHVASLLRHVLAAFPTNTEVQVPPPCGRREQTPQSALQGGPAAIGARLAL
jgi:hypothetical protein